VSECCSITHLPIVEQGEQRREDMAPWMLHVTPLLSSYPSRIYYGLDSRVGLEAQRGSSCRSQHLLKRDRLTMQGCASGLIERLTVLPYMYWSHAQRRQCCYILKLRLAEPKPIFRSSSNRLSSISEPLEPRLTVLYRTAPHQRPSGQLQEVPPDNLR
jgi:hypothetical protein